MSFNLIIFSEITVRFEHVINQNTRIKDFKNQQIRLKMFKLSERTDE
jgi:hypothetical protein